MHHHVLVYAVVSSFDAIVLVIACFYVGSSADGFVVSCQQRKMKKRDEKKGRK